VATLIPLGDASRQPRRFAVVTLLIILANAYVFLRELIEGDAFVLRWAVIPARIMRGRHLITARDRHVLHRDGCTSWAHGVPGASWAGIEDAMGRMRFLVST